MTTFNPYSHEFHDDPFPVYRELRDNAPCYYNPDLDFWAFSRYDDVLAALHDPDTYCSRYGITLEADNPLPMLLTTDPPDHTDLRRRREPRVHARAAWPISNRKIRTLARSSSSADCSARGEGDLVADYAARLPMDVIARMLGVPEHDEEQLRVWTNALLDRDEGVPDVTPEGVAAATHLYKYFCDFVAERRATIAAGRRAGRSHDRAVRGGGGRRRARRSAGGGLPLPVDHRGQRDHHEAARQLLCSPSSGSRTSAARSSTIPAAIPDAVEEILRYEGSTQMMARTLTRPVELHGAADARRREGVAPPRLGQPRRARVGSARRVRHRPRRRRCSTSGSVTASTCASAPRSPGSRCA